MSNLLQQIGHGQGYLKAGFQGFQGSGKSYTAVLLAIATREKFGLKGPVAFVDTENASEYVAPLLKEMTGVQPVGIRTRQFPELVQVANEVQDEGISVLIVDSVSHFWRNVCDAHLTAVNEARKKKGWRPKRALEFQDWSAVKKKWEEWTDAFVNSAAHIIICGRAGYEYDMEQNEETERKELVKTGVKMKTEGEFGYEPSLLVQMDIDQVPDDQRKGKFKQLRSATILKDRFGDIDSKVFSFPRRQSRQQEVEAVKEAFGPHLDRLKPGTHTAVTTGADWQEPEEADGEEKRTREILCEEIQGLISHAIPGQGSKEKAQKADLMQKTFGTRSWTKIQGLSSNKLREGLDLLRHSLEPEAAQSQESTPAQPEEDDVPMGNETQQASDLPAQDKEAEKARQATKTAQQQAKVPNQAAEAASKTKAEAPPSEDPNLGLPEDAIQPALEWLVKNGWLTQDQADDFDPFSHLTETRRKKIQQRQAQFLRSIGYSKGN